jgi:hypothetical protein
MICARCHGTRKAAPESLLPCPECDGQGATSRCDEASRAVGEIVNGEWVPSPEIQREIARVFGSRK